MAKDKTEGMQRIDLRIPSNIYSDIEAIAIERGLPYAPTTKPNRDGTFKRNKNGDIIEPKVSVSPVILDLIELGLTHLKKNGKEVITSGGKPNQVENNSLLVDILKRLEALEKLTAKKTDTESEYVKNLNAIDVTPIPPEVKKDNEIEEIPLFYRIKNALGKPVCSIEEVAKAFECSIEQIESKENLNEAQLKVLQYVHKRDDGNYDNNTYEILISKEEEVTLESTLSELPIEPINEDLGDKIPDTESALNNGDIPENEVKSFNEAVIVATKLKKDGLGNTAIAKELTGKFYTKGNKTNWSDTQVRRLFETKK